MSANPPGNDPTQPAQGTAIAGHDHARPDSDVRAELLGLVAYASLAAFERTAAASAAAGRVADKLVLARVAAQRFSHLDTLERQLAARGRGLQAAMEPFVVPIDSFNEHTEATTWGEALVKLCVVGGLVADFAAEVSPALDPELREILLGSIDDAGLADQPGEMLARELERDPDQQGRLALFARRLLAEALSQAQRVSARHAGLTALLTGLDEHSGDDLAAISAVMGRLATQHARRTESLGLG